jgi:hypothetical protein
MLPGDKKRDLSGRKEKIIQIKNIVLKANDPIAKR